MKEMNDETLDHQGSNQNTGGLPSFLNVLTILTFIGSGLGIIGGLYGLTTIEQQRESIELMRNMSSSNPFFGQAFSGDMIKLLEVSLEHVYLLQGMAIAVALACIAGAFLMRSLKKTGFYLYMIATAVSIALPIMILGMGLMGGLMMTGHIFTVAFVVMYSVNFKYLK